MRINGEAVSLTIGETTVKIGEAYAIISTQIEGHTTTRLWVQPYRPGVVAARLVSVGARKGNRGERVGQEPVNFPWLDERLSRAERVIAFIEDLPVSKGILAGTKMVLLDFQKEFIRAIYDPAADDGRRQVRLALLSIGRKN